MIIAAVKTGGSAARLPLYSYTGPAPLFFRDASGNWELVLTGSGSLRFSRLRCAVDVFAVGGGMPAGDSVGSADSGYARGGAGGRGGGCVTARGLRLAPDTDYPVQIGASSLSTSAFGLTAPAGGGAGGGAGAASPGSAAGNGGDGALAFGEGDTLYENGTPIRFGAGGGGGAARGAWNLSLQAAGSGGATGGGAGGSGGSDESADSKAGLPNTGGGGGGASRDNPAGSGGNFPGPGRGGSGVVIIRNAREEA